VPDKSYGDMEMFENIGTVTIKIVTPKKFKTAYVVRKLANHLF
jgi:hypothetical protein